MIFINQVQKLERIMKPSFLANNRSQSLNSLKYVRKIPLQTLAQKNLVSLKQSEQKYDLTRPLRILLPPFFNIPKFIDKQIDFQSRNNLSNQSNNPISAFKEEKGLKKKLKDIEFLAQGMKRAKNIREQSRYYFIEGVILHNSGFFEKSIEMFQKFLKIVLFIKDDKSVQLALNSIAIAYMNLKRPQQALQYHQKQQSLNQSSEGFIGKINMGFCYEMMKDKTNAYQIYTQIRQRLPKDDKRKQFLDNLLRRTKPENIQNYFLTENKSIALAFSPQKQNLKKKSSKEQLGYNKFYRHKSPERNINNLQFESSFSKRKYESEKVNFAIFNAEENLHTYIKDLKNSFTTDL